MDYRDAAEAKAFGRETGAGAKRVVLRARWARVERQGQAMSRTAPSI